MNDYKNIDITDYFYQKLSYYLVFDEDIHSVLLQFSDYLLQSWFWQVFQQELSFLLSRHCLLEAEVNRIYIVFQMVRTLDLDKQSWEIINECIRKLNRYKTDMNIEYYDGFYYNELKKRFPDVKISSKNIGSIGAYIPIVKFSLAADFPLLWSLIQDDDEIFLNSLLPSISIEYPFISNIRAFAFEQPDLFTAEIFRIRLQMIIEKWEQKIKGYSMIDRIKTKQKIRQYREYLK